MRTTTAEQPARRPVPRLLPRADGRQPQPTGTLAIVPLPMMPSDPNEWSDEQWIEWLETAAAAERAPRSGEPDEPTPVPSWRRAPLAVQFLAASMIGVAE